MAHHIGLYNNIFEVVTLDVVHPLYKGVLSKCSSSQCPPYNNPVCLVLALHSFVGPSVSVLMVAIIIAYC